MNLFIKDEYGHIMTITPEELKEKLGITFDIVALGVEVNDGETTIKAQSYPRITAMETRLLTSAWLPKAMRCRLLR